MVSLDKKELNPVGRSYIRNDPGAHSIVYKETYIILDAVHGHIESTTSFFFFTLLHMDQGKST